MDQSVTDVSRLEKVKDRIRKLLAIAADDKVADGEITAAMGLAEKAMQQYHLELADIEMDQQKEGATLPEKYGKVGAKTYAKNRTVWENYLFNAVKTLVGTVSAYRCTENAPVGVFQKSRLQSMLMWYGPAEDAQMAADMYEEWVRVVSTLALGKYGNCAKGDGARYAAGFCEQLWRTAQRQARERETISTAATCAIVKHGGGTLAEVLKQKQLAGKEWVQANGTKIYAGRKASPLKATHSGLNAYANGQSDGKRAEFRAVRTRKLT